MGRYRHRKTAIIVISAVILFCIFLFVIFYYSLSNRPMISENVLFRTHDGIHYRVGCVAVSKNGTYIAVASKRTSLNDWTKSITLVYKTSIDGITWSQEKTLVENKGLTNNNPVVIADNDGCFHFIHCVEYGLEGQGGGVYYMRSEDNGETWTSPVDISENTLKEYRNVFATGPGHGICLSDGTLMISVWMVPKKYGAELQSHSPAAISNLIQQRSWGDVGNRQCY